VSATTSTEPTTVFPAGDQAALRLARLVLGDVFASSLAAMERAQWSSEPGQLESRCARLARLLEHASRNVPFYRSRVVLASPPATETAAVALGAFPITTKRDLLEAARQAVLAEGLPPDRCLPRSTSGSTGEPFEFCLDRQALPVIFASHVFYDRSCGLELGDKRINVVAPIAGRPDPPRGAPASLRIRNAVVQRLRDAYEARTHRQLGVDDVTFAAALRFWHEVEVFRPTFVVGYSSALAALSAELLQADLPMKRHLRRLICIAEPLTPQRRELIERYFDSPITVRYGLRELGGWTGQSCSSSPECVHVNPELVVWEIVASDGSPSVPGAIGRLVLTDLHNLVMPFIRYDTGDLAADVGESCPCGRTWPLIRIEGRAHDCLWTRSGRVITPRRLGLALSESVDEASQYQILQDREDQLSVLVVPTGGFDEPMRARIRSGLEKLVGREFTVRVEAVERIAADPSGKRPLIKTLKRA